MKAMLIEQFGQSDVFKLADIDKPQIRPGHVLIKVHASSVNTVDTMIRQMGPELPLSPQLPAVLGMDFSGVIEEVAPDVNDFKPGDEVYGCAGGLADLQGSLAQYMLADSKLIALKPKTLDMPHAAAIPLVGITAYEGLQRAQVKPGEKVLVHGGSGGVGHIALQLAKHMGAHVYATGGNDESLSLIQELGATPINYKTQSVQDYVQEHTSGQGFDVVFDSVGGPNIVKSFEAAALNARISTTVSLLEVDLTIAHFKGLSLNVVFMLIPMLHNFKREAHGKILQELANIADQNQLKAILDQETFSFEDIAKAHDRLNSGKAIGKVVVTI